MSGDSRSLDINQVEPAQPMATPMESEGQARSRNSSRRNGDWLRDEQERAWLAAIVECSFDAIIGKTLDGIITNWNASAERMYGYTSEEAIGQSIAVIIPSDRRNELSLILEKLRRGERVEPFETVRVTKDGRRIDVSVTVSPIRDGAGRIVAASAIARDISEQKRDREELRRLNETLEARVAERSALAERRAEQLRLLVSELVRAEQRERRRLAQVLHDHLQQLIVAAKITIGSAERRVEDERLRKPLGQVKDLLDQAIAESRSLTMELSPPILYDAGLAAALEWLGRHTKEKHDVQVEVEVDPHAQPEAEEIGVLVFQAVRELLSRLVQHAHSQSVRIELRASDSRHCRVTITDDGPGSEGDRPDADAAPAFGLLSLQERLEWIGGRLDIDVAPGKGTRATLTVPKESGV